MCISLHAAGNRAGGERRQKLPVGGGADKPPALTVAARGIGLLCAFGCIFLVVTYRTFAESRIILYSLFW